MVKQMADETLEGYTVWVESDQSMWKHAAQFETLCSFAASLAEDLFRQGQLIGFAIDNEPTVAVRRLSDLMQFLEALAQLQSVESYQPVSRFVGKHLITFKPGDFNGVDAYVGGKKTGTAQPG